MKKLFLVLSAATFLSLPSFADEEAAGPAAEAPSQSASHDGRWKFFELGGFIGAALPGDFTNVTGSPKNGFGLGYGFNGGIRTFPYLTVGAILEGIFHGMDDSTTTADEFASNATLGLTAKIYPMGDWGPRAYLLVGISYLKLWIHDGVEFLPEDGTGLTYSGTRYSLGFGYEFPVHEKIVIFTELDLARQILKRQVFKSSPSIELANPATRWCPTVRVGVMIHI